MEHVVSLSDGKDSTAMLLMMLERNMPIDYIVFVDTTKEFPQVYRHLDKLGKHISPSKLLDCRLTMTITLVREFLREGSTRAREDMDFRVYVLGGALH